MSDETTAEMLAEIEGQAAEYTPPDGWRVLQPGEALQPGDAWAHPQADLFEENLNLTGVAGKHGYHLRRIEQRKKTITTDDATGLVGRQLIRGLVLQVAEAIANEEATEQPQPQPEPIITPDDVAAGTINEWPSVKILRQELEATEAALLEQQQRNEQLVTQGSQQHMEIAELQAQVRFLKNRELTLGTRLEEEKAVTTKRLQQIEELRSEVSHVQRLWGESRRRVEELETLVKDLRNINATAEKSAESAARQNADLQHRLDTVAAEFGVQVETNNRLQTQLEAVKAELAQVSKDRQRLQIELDAAQQVPADSPELRQLRADLEQVTRERDEYRHAHELLLSDANTVHERTKAMTVEAIAEWLEPVRLVDHPNLSNETLQHLPQIMRSLVGLDTPEDVD